MNEPFEKSPGFVVAPHDAVYRGDSRHEIQHGSWTTFAFRKCLMNSPRLLLPLVCLALAAGAAHAQLEAGAAAVDITPPTGGMMGGYGDRFLAVSTGVHDPLHAKALVLKDADAAVAVVTLDLVGVPSGIVNPVKEAIREQTGVEHVMLLASHTHSGPDDNERFMQGDRPYVEVLRDKIAGVVKQAYEGLAPARYAAGKGHAAEGHNRRKILPDGSCEMFWANPERVPTEPVDYEVGVIRFEREDGEPLATLVNFTCHPVILGPANLEISADWPGVMQREVEQALGGVCLYAQGACGDINPYLDKTAPADGAFEEAARMGRVIAQETVRVVQGLEPRSGAGVTAATESVPIALRWDIADPAVIAAFEKHYGKWLVSIVKKRLAEEFGGPLAGDLVTVTLGGDVAIAAVPGEFFVQHGLDLKRRCAIPNTFVFGYCNKGYGYFPTINAAWEGGYGGKEATVVEVGAGERFMNLALRNIYYQTGRLHKIPQF